MYKCRNCGKIFDVAEVKKPDAGHTITPYEFRTDQVKPLVFCPHCLSLDISVLNVNVDSKRYSHRN